MAIVGDSVRLIVRFRTFNGNPVDPTNVKLRILDGDTYEEIESFTVTDGSKTDIGVYKVDYVVPEGDSEKVIYEFSGVYNDKPILARGSFNRAFIWC